MNDQKLRDEVAELTEIVKDLGESLKKLVELEVAFHSQLLTYLTSNEKKSMEVTNELDGKAIVQAINKIQRVDAGDIEI